MINTEHKAVKWIRSDKNMPKFDDILIICDAGVFTGYRKENDFYIYTIDSDCGFNHDLKLNQENHYFKNGIGSGYYIYWSYIW